MMDGSALPRSVRWRIQLGLLNVPTATTRFDSSDTNDALKSLCQQNKARVQEQREKYDALVEAHFVPFMEQLKQDEQHEKEDYSPPEENQQSQDVPVDPLTAMLMETQAKEKRREEIDLKYRRERARRKRGVTTSGGHEEESGDCEDEHSMNVQTRIMIQKDLNRLQPEHYSHHLARMNNKKSNTTTQQHQEDIYDECVAERNTWLEQVLLIHAMMYPQLGYRQGMHEIASYLLFVLEMDLLQQEEEESDGGCLLDGTKLVHDAYHMFDKIMLGLSGAYDVVSNHSSSNKTTPMETMAKSILLRIRHVAQDEALYTFLTKPTSVAPQLYCTKWVRLMFSREVTGWRNVLLLWDDFFNLTSCHKGISSKRYDTNKSHGAALDLQTVLELNAACRIMLIRTQLLRNSTNVNESIHLLMNMESLESVTPLVNALEKMTERLADPTMERTPLILAPSAFVDAADRRVDVNKSPTKAATSQDSGPLATSLNLIRDALLEQQPATIGAQQLGESLWKTASNIVAPDNDEKDDASKAPVSTGTSSVVDPLMGKNIKPVSQPPQYIDKATTKAAKVQQQQQHQLRSSKGDGNEVSLKEMFSSSLKRLTTPTATDSLFGQHNSNHVHAETPVSKPYQNSKQQPQSLTNRDLADKLHGCVLTIQQFLMKTTAASPITPHHDQLQTPTKQQQQQDMVVPEPVWEALAEIETVRMHLLQHQK